MDIELDHSLRARNSEVREGVTGTEDIADTSRTVDAGAPDGGYGWTALAASSVLCFWFVGTTYCWGVIQDALVADGLAAPSTLSFVGSLSVAFIAFMAIINARILSGIGSRTTAFCGVALLSGGELLGGFSTHSVGGLFATIGFIMGAGVSLCFMVVSSVPAQYFHRKRGLANGIVFASGGLGGAVISFLMDNLIRRVGIAWTFRVIGSLVLLTGLPAAWFVRDRVPLTSRPFIDRSLFKDSSFVLLFFAGTVATFPLLVPPFFLPLYAASIHLSSSAAAGLVAAFNFASAIGRIGAGFLSDRIGPLNTLLGSLALSALSMLVLWPISATLGPLVTFAIINGAANGGFFALMPTIAGQLFGSARVSIAMGMLVTGWSGGYLMGSPIAGYLLAAYGGEEAGFEAYRPAIYYAGSMTIAATVLIGLVRVKLNTSLIRKL